MSDLIVTCDGACRRGVGGYGFVVQERGSVSFVVGGSGVLPDYPTTNQRAELWAALSGIEAALEERPSATLTVVSDSAYLINCFVDEWHVKWLANGWRSSKGGDVLNRDLWERLVPLRGHVAEWLHVRGHQGHPMNEYCDRAATRAIEAARV